MSRRTQGIIFLAVVIGLVVLGAFVILRTQGERIALTLGDFLTDRLGRGRNISIEFGNISGSLVDDVRLDDVIVTYTGGESPRILFSASEVHAYFSIPRMVLGPVQVDSVIVLSPRIIFPKGPDGSRLYPIGDSKPGPGGKPSTFSIDRIRLEDADIVWDSESIKRFRNVNATVSYSKDRDGHRIGISHLDFDYGKDARIDDIHGTLAIMDDRVRIGSVTVVTPRSGFGLSGYLGKSGLDSLALAVAIDSLDFGEMPVFVGRSEKPGLGHASGQMVVRGTYGQVNLDLALDGAARNLSFSDLNAALSYSDRTLKVDRLSMLLRDTPFDLSGEYEFNDPPKYTGVVAFSGLDLSRFFGDPDGSFSSDLNGSVGFSGRGTDRNGFSLMAAPHLEEGRYTDYRFDSVRGVVEVTAERVVLDSVVAGVSGTTVVTRGPIGYDGNIDLHFDYECPDLAGLIGYHGVEGLSGSAVGTAGLKREDGSLLVTASSLSEEIGYKGAVMDSAVSSVELTISGAGPEGRCEVFGRGLNLMGYDAGELLADVGIEDRRLDIERFALTREGGSVMGLVGAAEFQDGGVEVAIDNLFVELAGLIWENPRPLAVSYSEGTLSTTDFALASEIGQISLERGTYSDGRYDVSARVEGLDMGLLRKIAGDGIPSGMGQVSLDVGGAADSIAFDLDFSVSDGDIRGIGFQRLSGDLGYTGGVLTIRRMDLTQNGGDVVLQGTIPLDLAPSRVRELARQGQAINLIDDLGEMELNVTDVDVALLEPLFPPLARFSGTAALNMHISGRKDNPRIVSSGTLSKSVFGESELGDFSWELSLEDSVLSLSPVAFGMGDEKGLISGSIPLAISILPFDSRLLDRPIDVAVKVEKGNLGLLCDVFERLKVCQGEYEVDLRVGGVVTDPTFDGFVKLRHSRLRLEGVAQDILDLDLDLLGQGKRFEISKLVAEGGALKAKGSFTLEGTSVSDWDLKINMSNYEVTEFEDFYARLDGDLEVKAVELEPGVTTPSISGNIKVKEGEYFFSPDVGGGEGGIIEPTANPSWIMDVLVEIPKAFWIKGDVVQAELQGDLSVRRGKEGLSVLGTLTTLRGKFNVYHNSMRISKGEFRFIDVKSFRNAYIDLEASTTVLDERIDLRATGYLDELDISATSESGWSEQQIFEALLLRRGVASSDEQAGNKFFSDAFLQSWGTALVNRFGDDVARELHLDQFGIEVAGSEEVDAIASTWLTFGKYVSDDIYVQYSQSLGSLYGDLYGDRQRFTPRDLAYPERQLSVEYRFSNRLSVEGETGTISGLEYFDFDLKFRLGY